MKKIKFMAISIFGLFNLCFAAEESITITTYYPSPYGSYNSLQTDKLGVGDNNGDGNFTSADVPTTTGDVWIKGKVGIGTTGAGYELEVAGDIGADAFYYRSDESVKENIQPISHALEKIIALRGVKFNFKFDKTKTETIGLIAQEVEKVLPEIVSESEESGLKFVDYAKVGPVLIEAVKEQQKQIEILKTQLAELQKGN